MTPDDERHGTYAGTIAHLRRPHCGRAERARKGGVVRSQEPALTALRRYAEARNAARSEDLLFMLETGESLTGAAERLGLTTKALEKWLERRKMFDELRVLRSRDPITDFDFDKSASGRINAGKRYGWAS